MSRVFKLRSIKSLLRRMTSPLRSLPHFVVVGVQKGGTRFFYHCLDQHPSIALANEKEVHFFDRDYSKGLNWYKSYFPLKLFSNGKVIGEVTPRYIFTPEAPKRCHALLPAAKIIILLRDPIERAHSHYQMTRRVYGLDIDFKEFVKKAMKGDLVDIESKEVKHSKNRRINAVERGLYSEQIKRWLEYYPREKLLFIESELLFAEPDKALKKTFDFLEIDEHSAIDTTPQHSGDYNKEEIDKETRELLREYYQESNDWLRKQGFHFEWLKKH